MGDLLAWLNANEGVGTWVGAVATGGALIWAAITYWRSERHRRGDQARSIVLTATHTVIRPAAGPLRHNDFIWRVHNNSGDNIYQLTVQATNGEHTERGLGDWQVLAPGEERESELHIDSERPAELYMEFRDSAGQGWRRVHDGRLMRRRKPWPLEQYHP